MKIEINKLDDYDYLVDVIALLVDVRRCTKDTKDQHQINLLLDFLYEAKYRLLKKLANTY